MATLQDFRDALEPFLPAGVPWETQVRFRAYAGQVGAATLASAVGGGYTQLGYFDPDVGIVLHRRELDTAAGRALLAHEAHHATDAANYPGGPVAFMKAYDAEEARRRALWLPPYMNRLEIESYTLECRVWHSLVNQGVEPGSWLPLGVEARLCE